MMGRGAGVAIVVLLMVASLVQMEDTLGPTGAWRPVTVDRDGAPVDCASPEASMASGLLGCDAAFFLENRGQLQDPSVRYYAQGSPLSVGLKDDGLVFVHRTSLGSSMDVPRTVDAPVVQERRFMLDFLGCNAVVPRGAEPRGSPTNFYIGPDPALWTREVTGFSEVLYEGLYDGVDLRYYFMDGMLKYELRLAPGVGCEPIQFRFDGILGLGTDEVDGALAIKTPFGTLVDSAPTIWQEDGALRNPIGGAFALIDDRTFGFVLPEDIDPALPTVIDPGLLFSTYLGGSGADGDWGAALEIGRDGRVFVCIATDSADFDTTPGVYDRTYEGGGDLLVAALDHNCSRLLASTFIGGDNQEIAYDMAMGDDGDLYIVGLTVTGSTFPVTAPGAFDMGEMGGYADGFLVRLSHDLSDLEFSALIGGNGSDSPNCISLRDDGSLVISGMTWSENLPTTEASYQRAYTHAPRWEETWDLFVLKVTLDPPALVFCTYLGGGKYDYLYDMAVTDSGEVYLCGYTWSEDYPVTPGAYCTCSTLGYFLSEGIVSLLSNDGSNLLRSTYYEDLDDMAIDTNINAITILQNGSVCVAGHAGWGLPVTNDTLTPDNETLTFAGGGDAFISMFDADLSALQYGTYYGGSSEYDSEMFLDIAYDAGNDTAYVYGITSGSQDIVTTKGAFAAKSDTTRDTIVAGFDLKHRRLTYATAIGGSRSDCPDWIAESYYRCLKMDANGTLYLLGMTKSTDFPTTEGAYCSTFSGLADAFVFALDPRPEGLKGAPVFDRTVAGDRSAMLEWEPLPREGAYFRYNLYKGTSTDPSESARIAELPWTQSDYLDTNVTNGITYRYWLAANSSAGEGPRSVMASVLPLGTPSEPLNLTASTGDRRVSLTWTGPNETGGLVEGYAVFRGPTPGALAKVATVGNMTAFIDASVSCNTTYYYAVAAFNALFDGPMGGIASVVPMGPPSSPVDVTSVEGDGTIEVAWSPPENAGGTDILGYRVYRGVSAETLAVVHGGGAAERSFLDTGLQNGQVYYYAVVAFTMLGEGDANQFTASPYTLPGEPIGLLLTAGNRTVTLTWGPPASDGGRPITGYILYFWTSPEEPVSTVALGNLTAYQLTPLTNGVTYYFRLSALNARGEGPKCPVASATPLGPPGTAVGLLAEATEWGVHLSWQIPADTGGVASLTYVVLRGQGAEDPQALAELVDATEHNDTTTVGGGTYFYIVVAKNPVGEGLPSARVEVHAVQAPGPVQGFAILPGDGSVNLTWSAPLADGGSAISGYVILRGSSGADMRELARVGTTGFYNDTSVVNGQAYVYSVRANNSVWLGQGSGPLEAKPLSAPGPVRSLKAKDRDGKVLLTWMAPFDGGCAQVTGYNVLRWKEGETPKVIAELGLVLTYEDAKAERGQSYRYDVVPTSELGGAASAEPVSVTVAPRISALTASTIGIVLVLLVILAAYIIGTRARRSPVAAEGAEGLEAQAVAVKPPTAPAPIPFVIEEAFLVYNDGRQIAHRARDYRTTRDVDFVSGMLIAIQGIIQDGLKREGSLESMKYGDDVILMGSGAHVSLALVVYGQPQDDLRDLIQSTIARIEGSYAGIIERWTGEVTALPGVEDMLAPVIERTASVRREDVALAKVERTVAVLSAVDLYRGYVRLKAAVVNSTDAAIVDATIDLHYDSDMLRLERIEPPTLSRHEDRVPLGNIKPGERKTVAFLLDPLICQSSHIEGTLTYYDPKGNFQSVEMKRRSAEVVCPVFFTKEHANTAMLRRLVADRLTMSDSRAFRFPKEVSGDVVLRLAKASVVHEGVQLVREFIVKGPPFAAEVWYYGETRVKGHQIVMRLRVLEDKRIVDFYAASTVMEPITGLLAEFRRELELVLGREFKEGTRLELERDETIRKELDGQKLLLQLIFDEKEADGMGEADGTR